MKFVFLYLCFFIIAADSSEIEIISESVSEMSAEAAFCSQVLFGPAQGSSEVHMYLTSLQGDTIWSCSLQGTHSDFYNSPELICANDGSFLVSCSPDCFSGSIPVQRISHDGEILWFNQIETESLLDDCEFVELPPRINSMIELRSGDFAAAGHISPYLGAPAEWFAVCLSGTTGKLIWKIHGNELGFAGINALAELSTGMLLAAGGTAESLSPGGAAPGMVRTPGEYRPLIIMLGDSGSVFDSFIPALDLTEQFTGITPTGPNSFLLTGSGSKPDDTTETVIRLTL